MDEMMKPPKNVPATEAKAAKGDAQFLTRLGTENDKGRALGQLAVSNAGAANVKSYAEGIVRDADLTREQIARTASEAGVALEATPQKPDATLERLGKLKGAAFDRAVVTELQANRSAMVDVLKSVTDGNTPQVKTFATTLLTRVEKQRDEAKLLIRDLASR